MLPFFTHCYLTLRENVMKVKPDYWINGISCGNCLKRDCCHVRMSALTSALGCSYASGTPPFTQLYYVCAFFFFSLQLKSFALSICHPYPCLNLLQKTRVSMYTAILFFSLCICFQCAVPKLARMPFLQHYFLMGSNPSISNITIYL